MNTWKMAIIVIAALIVVFVASGLLFDILGDILDWIEIKKEDEDDERRSDQP